MKSIATMGFTALTVGLLTVAAVARAETQTWNGLSQDDAANFRHGTVNGRYDKPVVGRGNASLNHVGNRTWDGHGQDDASHYEDAGAPDTKAMPASRAQSKRARK